MKDSSVRPSRLRAAVRVARQSTFGILCAAVLALWAPAAHAGSVSYTYDALGRLAKAVYGSGTATTTISYSYDAAGNRTSVVTTSQ